MNRQHKTLASDGETVPVFPVGPFQIVTLFDMLEFHAYVFYLFITKFEEIARRLEVPAIEDGKHKPLAPEEVDELRREINKLHEELESSGVTLNATARRIKDIKRICDDFPSPVIGSIFIQIKMLREDLEEDLRASVFMSLSPEEAEYYDINREKKLFDAEVFTNFPGAQYDVMEAGNCFATGRYTACVFHCARVVEKGLQALALSLNSRFGADVRFGDKDIRYINWGNILQKIEREIGKLIHPDRKPRLLEEDLSFYANAAKEFVYIKILWRDPVSHSRSEYDKPTAESVMNHVKAFMKHLAENGLTEVLITTDNDPV